MPSSIVELLAAAATDIVGSAANLAPLSCATWCETRHDDDFDADSAIKYLRVEGRDVDESLIHAYQEVHRHHTSVSVSEITTFAPWIDCLNRAFVEYASFRPLRVEPRYIEIITFTTPAISDDGTLAFLELWTENGSHAQMGVWWWLQMRRTDGPWTLHWKHMHAIS